MRFRKKRALLALALIAASLVQAPGHVAAATKVPDPERSSDAVTGWHWWRNRSEAQLKSAYKSKGERIVDLEVDSKNPYRFTAALVKNKGPYKRTWWWYYGKSESQVISKTAAKGGRIIDLEPYTVNGKRRFAFVMVKNSGSASKGWWWNYDLKPAQVTKDIDQHGIRLIDLDTYKVNGKRRYSYVGIKNEGVDKQDWWWYHNVTPQFVAEKLRENGARLIDLERPSKGKLTVVMQRNEGLFWLYHFGLTQQRLMEIAASNASRIVDIERYKSNGKTRYAAVLLNNADPESARLRSIFRDSLWKDSYFGVYLKKVDGKRYSGLAHDRLYQPMSVMKLVPHLYVIDRFDEGKLDLDTPGTVRWDYHPDKDPWEPYCPGDTGPKETTWESLRTTLTRALNESLNLAHEALLLKYKPGIISARVQAMGMKKTDMYYGCSHSGKKNWLSSRTTLVDMGWLFEGVETKEFFDKRWQESRNEFYRLMASWNTMAIRPIVQDEADKLGKSAHVDAFMADLSMRAKGGSTSCTNGCPIGRALSYRVLIPYKVIGPDNRPIVETVPFVGGFFGWGIDSPCAEEDAWDKPDEVSDECLEWAQDMRDIWNKLTGEPLRPAIREALQTW